jgi:hypothetical protein
MTGKINKTAIAREVIGAYPQKGPSYLWPIVVTIAGGNEAQARAALHRALQTLKGRGGHKRTLSPVWGVDKSAGADKGD